MEPATVTPMNLDEEDSDKLDIGDDNTTLQDVNKEIIQAIDVLKHNIFKFKKITYDDIVNGDKGHDAADMGAMMTFHALYLQTVAFWIGLLDGRPVPPPIYKSEQHKRMMAILTNKIIQTARLSLDARTQVYSLLFRFSTQHPFEFAEN